MATGQKRLNQIAFIYMKGKKMMEFGLDPATEKDVNDLTLSVYDSLDVISEREANDFARAMLLDEDK